MNEAIAKQEYLEAHNYKKEIDRLSAEQTRIRDVSQSQTKIGQNSQF